MTDAELGVFGTLAGALIGAAAGLTPWLRDRLDQPKLLLGYEYDDHHFAEAHFPLTKGDPFEKWVTQKWVRVHVRNEGKRTATRCRIYLIDVAKSDEPDILHGPSVVSWPGYPQDYLPRDVPRGIDMYADVVHIRKGAAEYFFDIQERKLVSNARLKEPGSYRLKLLATADNAEPSEPLTVTVRYDGSWDSFHAERVSSLS